jgi:amino acid adenylation domain-containing protein
MSSLKFDIRSAADNSAIASEFYPLSEGQKGLWFLQRLSGDKTAYSITRAARITTALDITALQRAFQALVDRHRCLRTAFHEIDGAPLQRIQEQADIPFRIEDASGWSDEELMAHLAAEAARPFDLDRAPLLRVTLLLRSEHDPIMLLNIHHIVADLWSLSVLMKELAAYYQAEKNETAVRLPRLTLEYTDYVCRQAEMLAGEEGERLWRYWQERLGGEIPILNLPTDRPRTGAGAKRGGVVHLSLGRQLTDKLNRLSRELEITLYTTLLAGFNLLLHRYTGRRDIAVGSPTVGRRSRRLAGVLGYFVNPVVMRNELSGNPTFRELARRMRPNVLSALAHGGYPLPLLVKKLRPGQVPNVSPLFQVMFGLQNIHLLDKDGLGPFALGLEGGKLQVGELSFASMSIPHQAPQFDLTLMMCEDGGELKAYFEYDADLFDNQTIVRLAGHFSQLMESICLDPDHRIGQMRYLPEAESRQLIDDWNRHPRESLIHPGMPELFQQQAARAPDAVALFAGDQALTYRELNARANQLAHHLRRRGAGSELPVAVCMGRTPEMIITLLGILKSGSPYLPLDPAYPADRLRYMLDDTRAVLIVSHREWADAYADDARLVRLDLDWPVIAAEAETDPVFEQSPGQSAYLIYTSGSTGRPKGVVIEHRSFAAFLHWVREEFSDRELSGVLASTSICFDLSVFEIFGPLSWGGALILIENALQLAERREVAAAVQVINTVPSAIRELLRMDAVPDGGRTIALAGERLEPGLARDLYRQAQASRVLNLYGPSEDTTYSTLSRVPSCNDPEVTIGRGITGSQVYLLDSEMEIVGIGICGEIYLGGAGLARGYWDRPEITAERFLPDPFAAAGGRRLYRTGDLGRVRPDGEIEFLGRADHQVKIRGYRIELGEIERALEQTGQIRAATVVVREETPQDKRLVAYVVAEGEKEKAVDLKLLRKYLKEKLPDFLVPSAIVVLDKMPLTPNGKLDRKALPAPEQVRVEGETALEAPRTSVEQRVVEIYEEVLRLDRVGIHDNFFEIGGHSLLATQVISRVRAVFGVEMGLGSIFEEATAAGLAGRIEEATKAGAVEEASPLVRVDRTERLPLSYAQQRLWFIEQLEPGNIMYNCVGATRLEGELNLAALEWVINEVIRRHEVLRTRIDVEGDAPAQVIEEWEPRRLELEDLRGLTPEERDEKAKQVISDESKAGFDLIRGPLMRVKLLKLGDAEHIMLLAMHHIVSDAWSIGVLAREVGELYGVAIEGRASNLPELKIQYADYACWQRRYMTGAVLEGHLAYWKRQLAGDLPTLRLPTDHPQPTASSRRGASQTLILPAELSQSLTALSQREGVTLFILLLAAFKTLLYKYTAQEDIIIGATVANRTRAEIEPLIGFFVNMLPLRTDLSRDPKFIELLKRVKEVALGAYAHQDLPFEKLVGDIHAAGERPLFNVSFSVQNTPWEDLRLPGIRFRPMLVEQEAARFDLSLWVTEKIDGMSLCWTYSQDLFKEKTITRMHSHFETLLFSIVERPDARLTTLEISLKAQSQSSNKSGDGQEDSNRRKLLSIKRRSTHQ